MARKQRYGGEPRFYETELDVTSSYPPTSKAVVDGIGGVVAETVFEQLYLTANDKVYAITVDENGAVVATEVVTEEESGE